MDLLCAFPTSSLQSDSISVNQVIRSMENWRWAVRLFSSARDLIGANSALGVCGEQGHWGVALALLQSAVLKRLHPDTVSSTEVMSPSACDAYLHVPHVERVWTFSEQETD